MSTTRVVATATKETPDSKTGIKFIRAANGTIIINGLSEGSLFEASALKAGQEVVSINGTSCQGKTTKEAADMIRQAEGTITIVAQSAPVKAVPVQAVPVTSSPARIVATGTKQTKDSKAGIKFIQAADGTVVISGLSQGSIFEGSSLKAGQEVISVNDINCNGKASTDVVEIIRHAEGTVTIVAQEKAPVRVQHAARPVMASSNPPPGAPDGGVWGTQSYIGATTGTAACVGCICFGLPGLFQKTTAHGIQEVIVESPLHLIRTTDLTVRFANSISHSGTLMFSLGLKTRCWHTTAKRQSASCARTPD